MQASRSRFFSFVVATVLVSTFGCDGLAIESNSSPASSTSQSQSASVEIQDESSDDVISVNQTLELRKNVGQSVVVEGIVSRASASRAKHVFINFSNNEFYIFIPASAFEDFDYTNPGKELNGKKIRVSGKIERRDNRLQIVVTDQAQISLADDIAMEPKEEGDVAKFEFKSIGKNHWLSPAGLSYRGLDSEGETRIEHVKRHVDDIPNRTGSHGVFDGNSDQAFAVIDEAWEKIKRSGIRPEKQGNRWAYTVPMGRRVGYLGGRSGADRNHPTLSNVFIVVEADTSNVVTAFPK